jgi:hypothetical protein
MIFWNHVPSEVKACDSAGAVEWKEDCSQNAYRGLELLEILCLRSLLQASAEFRYVRTTPRCFWSSVLFACVCKLPTFGVLRRPAAGCIFIVLSRTLDASDDCIAAHSLVHIAVSSKLQLVDGAGDGSARLYFWASRYLDLGPLLIEEVLKGYCLAESRPDDGRTLFL